jgi:dTDP-4-amino-4,6-dideoxygalactose transaminase
MKVPFVDLKSQYDSIRFEIASAVQRVLEATAFAGGPFVAQFEKEFAEFCGTGRAVGVSSGTSALWLALKACEIGPGDEVITVPNTFIATAEAISLTGARPVFIDVVEKHYLMNPDLIERAVTPHTKAIIPVHLFGQVCDMDPIMQVAKEHRLYVIEDACQAHGAVYKGKRAGSIGDLGCFSFYPGKNLGAYGEAGAVVTNNREMVRKMEILRDHGQSEKYYHSVVGWNDRMDGIQGAVLSVKVKYLADWNRSRRRNAAIYSRLLGDVKGIALPGEADYREHVYHLYPVRCHNRDLLGRYLTGKEIGWGIHYPVPVHLQEAYRFLGHKRGDFPVAEACAEAMISLPMFAELTEEQIAYVCREIESFISGSRGVVKEDRILSAGLQG